MKPILYSVAVSSLFLLVHRVNAQYCPPCPTTPRVIYVKWDAPGTTHNGEEWPTAYLTLQDAIMNATNGCTGCTPNDCCIRQIWVARGTYRPGTQQSDSFNLHSRLEVYGGFTGTETSLAQRGVPIPPCNETILSGDLLGNDVELPCVTDADCITCGPCNLASLTSQCRGPCNNLDNSEHVVTVQGGTGLSAILDGFTITRGHATNVTHGTEAGGGGIRFLGTSAATIRNCAIIRNRAVNGGGGVYAKGLLTADFVDCLIADNHAGHGGGVGAKVTANARFVNCKIVDNTATADVNNVGLRWGAGLYIENFNGALASPQIINTLIARNETGASGRGAGIYVADTGTTPIILEIVNSTIAYNRGVGGIGGGIYNSGARLEIKNSILWGNEAPSGAQIYSDSATENIQYSNVQQLNENDLSGGGGVQFGTGNLGTSSAHDPLFLNRFGPEFAYELKIGSPCTDAGNSGLLPLDTVDLDGDGVTTEERIPLDLNRAARSVDAKSDTACTQAGTGTTTMPPVAEIVDMGAYERPLVADCNFNGRRDCADILGPAPVSQDCNNDHRPDECGVFLNCALPEVGKLEALPEDRGSFDAFGTSVSLNLSGGIALVGAPADNCAAGIACGAAYVYRRNCDYVYDTKLVPPDAAAGDTFGRSVSIEGTTAVIGAPGRDCSPTSQNCGAAYLYFIDELSTGYLAKLTASDAVAEDQFGSSVAISGNTIAVGAPGRNCPGTSSNCGAVYVFRRFPDGMWHEVPKITRCDGNIGSFVALEGDRVVTTGVDTAYVFRRNNNQTIDNFNDDFWIEEAEIVDVGNGPVSISGDVIVFGESSRDYLNCADCGLAHVYRRLGGQWTREAPLSASDATPGHSFGSSVSVSGDNIIVGASLADCAAGADCGAAYLYGFDGNGWIQKSKRVASDAAAGDLFGNAVFTRKNTAVVGARGDDCAAGNNCGAAYAILAGTDLDGNCNRTADRCDCEGNPTCVVHKPGSPPPPANYRKNRYITFTPNNINCVAFKLDKVTSPTGTMWVDAPDFEGFSRVVNFPVYRTWGESVINVGDCEIVPVATYEVRATPDNVLFSSPLTVSTIARPTPKWWGDTTGGLVNGAWDAPNGVVNANDFQMVLQKFLGAPTAPPLTMVDVQAVSSTDPCLNRVANIADVFLIIKAFQGDVYPFETNPANCPGCTMAFGMSPPGGGGGPEGFGPQGFGPESGSGVAFDLNAQPYQAQPGQTATVEVYVTGSANLGAFETALALTPAAGTVGTLTLESLTINSARTDYTFNGQSTVSGVNLADGKAGAALGSGSGTDITGPDYLSTYTYRASNDASGVWEVSVADPATTETGGAYLLDGEAVNLEAGLGDTKLIRVGVECTLDIHCDDLDGCTTDTCTNGVCVHAPVVCNDGNPCTTDACVAGVCQYTPITCNDGNTCTSDACVAGVCVYTNLPSGTACNDGLYCTKTDTCNGNGTCVGTGNRCKGTNICCESTDSCIAPGQLCPEE